MAARYTLTGRPLAQKVHLAVGAGHGIGILAGEVGEIGMRACGGVVEPHIAGHRRGVVLAPLVFKSLDILIQKLPAARQPAHRARRGAQHLTRCAAAGRHAVQLGHAARGKERAGGRVLYRCREEHRAAVGRPGLGGLGGGVEGDALGSTAGRVDHVDVEVAVQIRRIRQPAAVGAPHGRGLISRPGGHAGGLATGDRHCVYVAAIAEGNGASVGRNLGVAHPQRSGGHSGGRHQRGQYHSDCLHYII